VIVVENGHLQLENKRNIGWLL